MTDQINKVIVDMKDIGQIAILATNDQLTKLMQSGAKVMSESKEEKKDDGMYYQDNIGSEDAVGGFVGNKVDWAQFFPQMTQEEIDTLISAAKTESGTFRATITTVSTFLGIGLAIAAGGGLSSFPNMKILDIIGPFTKLFNIPTEDKK